MKNPWILLVLCVMMVALFGGCCLENQTGEQKDPIFNSSSNKPFLANMIFTTASPVIKDEQFDMGRVVIKYDGGKTHDAQVIPFREIEANSRVKIYRYVHYVTSDKKQADWIVK